MDIKHIINKLYYENNATKEELIYILDKINEDEKDYAFCSLLFFAVE